MGIVNKVRGQLDVMKEKSNIYCMLNNADILQARRLI